MPKVLLNFQLSTIFNKNLHRERLLACNYYSTQMHNYAYMQKNMQLYAVKKSIAADGQYEASAVLSSCR